MTKMFPANGTSTVEGGLPQPESIHEIEQALQDAPALRAAATLRPVAPDPILTAAPDLADDTPELEDSLLPKPSFSPRR